MTARVDLYGIAMDHAPLPVVYPEVTYVHPSAGMITQIRPIFHMGILMGPLMGGPQCRLSIFKKGQCPLSLFFPFFLSPVEFMKRSCRPVKFKGQGPSL